uniref:DUF1409 domain-containing protein n=1 Tax=Oryza sativa subsp. japonica TaxID=39947 RepID=Q2QV13_ORYSJ|nr:hypothetical protein LOC_Os12g14390 [Oryza sativa Japonica Group]
MVMKVVNRPSVTEAEFPLPEPIVGDDGQEHTHRRCTSYGEYASTPTDAGAKLSAELLKDWFCSFYEGFKKDARVWFPYEDSVDLELPSDFRFEDINHEKAETSTDGGVNGSCTCFHQSTSMYMTDLFPDVIPQTIDSSPPHQSNSGSDIEYAPDPSIEQALDEEEIGEDVDQAAVEVSDIERTPSTSPKQTSPTPSARTHFTRALADLFSFDIRDYLDETEEDTSSKALAPLSDDVKKTLEDICHRLEASSLDNLVVNCGPIRTRLLEIQALILDELADILTPGVYLEQHQFKLEKAKLRLAERRERKDIEATIQANRQLVHEEKSKLDQLSEGPIKSNIDRLEARKIELLAQLQECNAKLDLEHKKLADLPRSVEEQKARLK